MTEYIKIDRLKYLLDFAIKHIVKEGELILKIEDSVISIESNIHKKTRMVFHINGSVYFTTHERDSNRKDFDALITYLINQHNIIHWNDENLYKGRAEGWFCDEEPNKEYKAEINMLVNKVKYLEGFTNGF